MKNNRSKKIISVVLIIIIAFCGLQIFQKKRGYYLDSKDYEKLRTLSPLADSNLNQDPKEKDLKNINNDYAFWIKVDGTNIDFPVVQGKDNEFYLKHNFNKEKSFSGSIFVDYRNDINEDPNLIIYGHNMRNDTMFAQMQEFKNKNFFNNNKYITLYENGVKKQYEIFSIYSAKAKDLKLTPKFSNNDEFYNYEKEQATKSMFKRTIQLTPKDKIMTLVTCGYDFDDERLIIVAKEVQ